MVVYLLSHDNYLALDIFFKKIFKTFFYNINDLYIAIDTIAVVRRYVGMHVILFLSSTICIIMRSSLVIVLSRIFCIGSLCHLLLLPPPPASVKGSLFKIYSKNHNNFVTLLYVLRYYNL